MENKPTRFLNISLVFITIFCILVFNVQSVCMNIMGADAIKQLGVIYMSGMSEQIASHFGTIIELRLTQVEALVDAVPPERFEYGTPLQIELSYNARSAGFEYLAFYTSDEKFHMIYGSQVSVDVPKSLRRSVQGGNYNVSSGKDEDGTPIVLMGAPAAYPMPGGETSIGIVAGLPTSYLGATLESSLKGGMVSYSIISDDGSYVLQNSAIEESNYFDRIKNYESYNGKDPSEYAEEMREALKYDRDYTSEVMILKERWNIYCTKLPNSEWHLLLKISHNTLDETVDVLKKRWSFISVGGCVLILGALFLVFARYLWMAKKQMAALDEARRYAERSNRAKNEFLSNMSHDVLTPMNGIMGMTSIAIDNIDNPPRIRNCLKKINISSRHLLGLLNDMLDMSKIESGSLNLRVEPVCLRVVMQNIMAIILPQIQEKNQHFSIYIYDIYHEDIYADRVRLNQILLNILGNAIKFTPEGGRIEVDLHEEDSPKGDRYIRSHLHIGDNGIGMSEEFQKKIFDAFAREDNARVDKAAGGGMGMTITKYIVDAMGGTISVKSEQGKGSDFYVTLDMEKIMEEKRDYKLPGLEVLLIDDDEIAAETAKSSLESLGLKVKYALSLEEAFKMIKESKEEQKSYSIILLDWDIEEKDGVEAAKEIQRQFGTESKVILLSDGENDELETVAEEAGIDSVIVKPLFRSSLYYGLCRFTEESKEILPQPEESFNVDFTGKRILVAEDNEMNWEITEAILSEIGLELEWAENGQICVDKFVNSEIGWYDAILMDLRMPVMTGLEAAKAIRMTGRRDAKSIPIIAVSADAFADDVQKCIDYGMNAHTSKPIDLDKIIELLNQYFQ